MAIELTREQLAKINQVQRMLRESGLPKSIIQHRVNNYRRTLVLDMESYKRRPVVFSNGSSRRKELIADGKIPATVTPNAKKSANLDRRVRAWEETQTWLKRPGVIIPPEAFKRPGSLSK